jgi:hypothetical protein
LDEAQTAMLEQLKNDVSFAVDDVAQAIESGEERRQLDTGRSVEELVRRYQEFLASLGETARMRVESSLGRRVTDLRRAAAQLSRRAAGVAVARAVDAGVVPFLEQRTPGRSMESRPAVRTASTPKYSVGGEVEAFCGKCGGLRDHHIVAIVDGLPKQVICQSCHSRHGYRLEAARGGTTTRAAAASSRRSSPTAEEMRVAKSQEQKRALIRELDAVDHPRPFDPKGRYKAGEVILHPEHGKGKIENVLKGSLLVRFREGLRPLNLA